MLNNALRKKIVEIIYKAGEGHIPSSFSIVDILDYLYGNVLKYKPNSPDWEERDYFILSKGHGAAALYVVLNKYGILSSEKLATYSKRGSILGGHPDTTQIPGIEASTGSLGHGFSTAMGIALGLRIKQRNNRVFALLGDGECNEGTIWEAALVASKQKLSNLVAIIDFNGSAAQILPVDPLVEKWNSFGWNTLEINGHDFNDLSQAFQTITYDNRPTAIIAHTVKGKGISFIEGHGKWHHRIPNDEELDQIKQELK